MRFVLIISVVLVFFVSGAVRGQEVSTPAASKQEDRKPGAAKVVSPKPKAQATKADPQKANGDEQSLWATVVSVSGRAEKMVLVDGKKAWKPLQVGEKLGEKTVIRTGFRSGVALKFADRGQVTVNNATKMGIGEFRKSRRTVRTRLGLKYGAVRASVDSSRGPNDWRIKTPVATLSVRGTSGFVGYCADGGARCRGTSGRWRIRTANKTRTVFPKELRSTAVTGGAHLVRAIKVLEQIRNMQLGDTFGGLSRPEKKTLVSHGSGRTLLGGVKRRNLRHFLKNRPTSTISGLRESLSDKISE